MSAPQGPHARNSSRGRRGVTLQKPRVGSRDRQSGRLSPYSSARGTDPRPLKPPQNTGYHRDKLVNKPAKHVPLTSAIQSHAGKIPDPRLESWRKPGVLDSRNYKQRMTDYYQTLKQNRERERKNAIKDGFLADPDKPTSLANAITPVGTCQDMCPEFERVERIVQLMVDQSEKIPSPSDQDVKVPSEDIMVKRFRRSAAGYDEQLPSDIRSPSVLRDTLNYLIDEVVGGSEPLATVHKFVWDRTRGIRNDFSIQQVSKIEDLRTAIDCFERIARFHILSLHQLSHLQSASGEFDAHQEREQLNNTLLSLMYYYDDSRHTLISPNEAEFRAYCIVFEIQDQRPDLEDRAQNWPRTILKDPRVQTAFRLYAAAGNTADAQGPLLPRTQFLTAQANTGGFWTMVQSNAVSYLMACVSEIYFNLVRRTALEAIWKAYKGKRGGPTRMEDWTLQGLRPALGFETEEQTQVFCEEHDFQIAQREDGELYVDLGSVLSGNLTDQNPRRKPTFSRYLVENKRLGRTLPAVINGLSASQAQAQGLLEDVTDVEDNSLAKNESLFVDGSSDEEGSLPRSRSESPQNSMNGSGDTSKLNTAANVSGVFAPTTHSTSSDLESSERTSIFGRPTPIFSPNPFQKPTTSFGLPSSTPFSGSSSAAGIDFSPKATTSTKPGIFNSSAVSGFDFHAAAEKQKDQESHISLKTPDNQVAPNNSSFPFSVKNEGFDNHPNKLQSAASVNNKRGTFGQPSALLPVSMASGSASTPSDTSVVFPTLTTRSTQNESGFNRPSKSTASPKFTFATSSLFNLPEKNSSANTDQSPNESPLVGSDAKATDNANLQGSRPKSVQSPFPNVMDGGTLTQLPAPASSGGFALFQNDSPNHLSPFSNGTTASVFTPKPSPTLTSTPSSSLFPETRPVNLLAKPTIEPTSSDLTPVPSIRENGPKTARESQKSSVSNSQTTTTPSLSNATLLPAGDTQFDTESSVLSELADAVMRDDHGLLQQFLEYTVGPLIISSMAQLQDERSWEEARKSRVVLLSKKYSRRWRVNAWNLSIMRKGRERRRNFAKSLQASARKSTHRHLNSDSLGGFDSSGSTLGEEQGPARPMPPPSEIPRKRQSLPADLGHELRGSEAGIGTKRKRDDPLPRAGEPVFRPTKIHHRRSQTLGNSISAPPIRPSPSHRTRVDISKTPEGSMLYETLMKQARKVIPNAKSDTTRTDYFRLKALGIDPDTPVVPSTKKRNWDSAQLNGVSRSSKSSPLLHSLSAFASNSSPVGSPTQKPHKAPNPALAEDEDEALFAQLRSIREALAESQQWMQSERQSLERSMTPQAKSQSQSYQARPQTSTLNLTPLDSNETPAQRRLREIRERGHTPSRTEMRLRAMGDKALLPKGFWDRGDMGQSPRPKMKQEEVVVQVDQRRAEEGTDRSLDGHGPGKGRDKELAVLNDNRAEESTGTNAQYRSAGQEAEEHEVLIVNNDDLEDEEEFDCEEQFEDEYNETEEEFDEDEEEEDEGEEDYDEETYDENEDDKDEEGTHFREQLAPSLTGFAALNRQRQGFGNGQLGNMQGRVNGSDKAGTSVEDAIEL